MREEECLDVVLESQRRDNKSRNLRARPTFAEPARMLLLTDQPWVPTVLSIATSRRIGLYHVSARSQ